jgi:hypothetical protein
MGTAAQQHEDAMFEARKEQREQEWRERVKIAEKCPFNAVHGGCHYPDCASDCPGRPIAVTSGTRDA